VLIAGLSASALIAVVEPRAVLVAMTAPIVLSVMILAIAFDRRMALGVGSLMALLACICLYQPAATSAVSIAGLACAAMRLRDVHSRRAPISAGLWSGLGTFIAIVLLGSLLRPIADGAIQQTVIDAAVAAGFCILAGVIVLACIPLIERIFGITTGMTLVELRDPRHPLLRQLQQRAPGTYNHSLNVASLAETAADAIGADPLLAYVGALYHDVGKLNKPEYFVENQTPGINRHEKLAPATSLLVIVGHVRDGAELAREYNLPASLIHFIESHHGTTLVEYFYHRARKQAEAAGIRSGEQLPQEIEYRYPGPKPATREAAILMICDASESAARTLTDPTPMKLESLVRAIAHKRLMDGQFDASGLTLTDIHKIVDAVSRTLAAINHQRLAYPEPDRPKPPPAPPANPALTGSPSAANSGPAPQTGPLISTPVG
jgi:putative nucleotidyltransferase with HDIG domain